MATSSARPDNLDQFVGAARQLNHDVYERLGQLGRSYADIVPRLRWGTFDASGLLADFSTWINLNQLDARWVEVIATAFRQADRGSVPDASITAALNAAGVPTGPRLHITVDDPIVAGWPATSGFANDPVCTATGHFVESELDLLLPPRLGPMRWLRTYSSRWREPGPFGTGWASWASVRAEPLDGGALLVRFPDGKRVRFDRVITNGRAEFARVGGLPAELVATDDGGWELRWFGGGRWVFAVDGTVAGVDAGPGRAVGFDHDGDRLVALRHDNGRRLDLHWRDGRVVAVDSSDGRRATYRYDDRGELIEADLPASPRRYEVDDTGATVAVTDADGVELVRNQYDPDGRVVTQRSPFGRTTRFSYEAPNVTTVTDDQGGPTATFLHDSAGRLVGIVDDTGARMAKTYDPFGNPVAATDRVGNTTVQAWDHRSRLLRRDGPDGAVTRYEWDDRDRMVARTDPLGRVVRFTYDGDERLPSRAVDAMGATTATTVERGLITSVTDPDGVTTTLRHDADGLLTTFTDGAGVETRFDHDRSGELVAVHGAGGGVARIERDAQGRVVQRHEPGGGAVGYEWTPAGRMTASIAASGARATIAYGPHGEAVSIVDSTGAPTELRWDVLGNLSGLTDPVGESIAYAYDGLARLVEVVDPTGARWRREHDREGRIVATVNPEGERRTRGYDAAGRVSEQVDGAGHRVSVERDGAGNVVASTDANGATTRFEYDACGRRTAVVDPMGGRSTYEWSPGGRLLAVTSPLGSTTRFEYDAAGRWAAIVDSTGGRRSVERDAAGRMAAASGTAVTYDDAGRVVGVAAPDGREVRYGYDDAGRVSAVTEPGGGTARFAFDAAGRLAEAIDPLGHATTFEYDAAGRLRRTLDALGGEQAVEYDAVGRLTGWTDQDGHRTEIGRDGAGRMVTHRAGTAAAVRVRRDGAGRVVAIGSDGSEPAATFELDAVGRIVRVVEADGRTTEQEWDAAGRLVRQESGGLQLGWRWDADGRQVAVVHPGGHETTFGHDGAGRVTHLRHPVAGDASIEYDDAGLPTRFTAPGIVRRWERDDGGRVVRFVQERDGVAAPPATFAFDGAGRVVTETTGDTVTAYTYDPAGQLVGCSSGGDRTWTWTYDAGGRRVRATGPGVDHRYRYDRSGRLVEVTDAAGATVLAVEHDPAGRRTRATGPAAEVLLTWDAIGHLSSISTRTDQYDDVTPVRTDAFGDLVAVGHTPVAWDRSRGLPMVRWIGGADVVGAWDPIAIAGPGGATWFPTDARGTVGAADVWGEGTGLPVHPAAGPVEFAFRDELSVDGLLWLRHRAYDPATAAFVAGDPLAPVLGSTTVANPYHYAGNDPIGRLDPFGLQPLTDADIARMRDEAGRSLFERTADEFGEFVDDPIGWAGDHADAIVAGLVIVGGVALCFTPLAPIGAGILIGAGTSMATQVAFTGEIDARQVWVDGLVGGLSGGAGGLAAGATAPIRSAALRYGAQFTAGAVVDTAGSAASQYLTTGHVDPTQLAIDGVVGGGTGMLGGVTRPHVDTPYGAAYQGWSPSALAARSDVAGGTELWRIGTTNRSQAAEAQFWGFDHPLTPGYGQRYGMPAENLIPEPSLGRYPFVEHGVVPPGAPFITRAAPGLGSNAGGALEVVTPSGGVDLNAFSIIDQSDLPPGF